MAERVNVDNFVRAETDRMFTTLQAQAGAVNAWSHSREPTSIEKQPVIRLNRDTLYSFAVVDLAGGATLTLPEPGERYVSAMVVSNDHYINQVFHAPGTFDLTADDVGTRYALIGVRTLVDPNESDDVAAVAALQDQLHLTAASAEPFVGGDFDPATLDATRNLLLELARGMKAVNRAFGRPDQVDPVHRLLGAAAGWGGLPESEAVYVNVEPHLPVGAYELTVRDVPVDAFWSISLYNPAGYFEQTDGLTSVNSVTAVKNPDGGVTVRFGGPVGAPNRLGIMDGWNYIVRMYRPHPEVANGSWRFPEVTPSES